VAGILPAAAAFAASGGVATHFDTYLDTDGNGVEDTLDAWRLGRTTWSDLRRTARTPASDKALSAMESARPAPEALKNQPGDWANGRLRLICLGARAGDLKSALPVGARVVHDLDAFGGVSVLSFDEAGLSAFLSAPRPGRILLDRDGVPALVHSRHQMGAEAAYTGPWQLGDDWSSSVAILDSGCDTAHDDLGDLAGDNLDGPPPAVGDAFDWSDAADGWPLNLGYKVVGWQDVTDDFPLAAGPWDYHHHGTALASVVAGSPHIDADFHGINPDGRLTVVKFYDFDEVWHAWAGDFLAACAWTLEHRETYRVRTVLAAVNWDTDAGLSDAMAAFVDAGIVPVSAMGNFGADAAGPGYPAVLQDVLTVGAVNTNGSVSAYSGLGLPGQSKPDMLAPGGGLLRAGGRIQAADIDPNDTYSGREGTSLAAAHTAGAVYLLAEALQDNGMILPADRESALNLTALLKATATRVDLTEDPDGRKESPLPPHEAPDNRRGWGCLRVDAAVHAVLNPLRPGEDQTAALSADWEQPVVARRLAISPDVRYLVEAIPTSGLVVALELVDPRTLDDDPFGTGVLRANTNGVGVSEFSYLDACECDWMFLVVKRVSGAGEVTLKVREADTFPQQGRVAQISGRMTGGANTGALANSAGPVVVIPSRVEVDPQARAVSVLDRWGLPQPGWPVFVFPHQSSLGGLTQPVVWDLDGLAGDEIVTSSDFGNMYFFNGLGDYVEVELERNMPLTTPVGWEGPGDERRVLAVDGRGKARSWSWGPVQAFETLLGVEDPLAPAVGQFEVSPAEEAVIVFADGTVFTLDFDGTVRTGWPVQLAAAVTQPPVLCDLDGNGLHEIIVMVLDQGTGVLTARVLNGDGSAGPGDGTVIAAVGGGAWLEISAPTVAGRYGTGDLRVSIMGLTDNGLSGDAARWSFGLGSLLATGTPRTETWSGLSLRATTTQGVLLLDKAILAPPVTWDYIGGTGTDEAGLVGVQWHEILYGLTSVPGSAVGLLQTAAGASPLAGREPVSTGGSAAVMPTSLGILLVPLSDGVHYRVQAVDDLVNLVPVRDGSGFAVPWTAARADQRNSGAYPLGGLVADAPETRVAATGLQVYPNPGRGRFNFRLTGEPTVAHDLAIYDLRGRLVRRMTVGAGEKSIGWDGRDTQGRQAAAGTYLVTVGRGAERFTTRLMLTR